MLSDKELRIIADRELRRTLEDSGFDHAEVSVRDDQSGEEAIFVTAHFRTGAHLASTIATIDARVGLVQAMQTAGEQRFPYIGFYFPDDEFPDEGDLSEAAE